MVKVVGWLSVMVPEDGATDVTPDPSSVITMLASNGTCMCIPAVRLIDNSSNRSCSGIRTYCSFAFADYSIRPFWHT